MKKLLLCILTITCLCATVAFAACGKSSETPATYTVTVAVNNADYGTVSTTSVENVAKNTAITQNGNVLTIGTTQITATATAATAEYTYTFTGWTAAATVTGNVTVTANFARSVRQYTITFEMNGGADIDPIQEDYCTPASELANIPVTAPNGYHFVKWELKTGENTYVDLPADAVLTEDITLRAVWEANSYTVAVESNNASFGTVSADRVTDVAQGTAITVADNTITIGTTTITATPKADTAYCTYSFVDWTAAETVNGNITVIANFAVDYLDTVEGEAFQVLSDENSCQAHTHGGPEFITVEGDTITYSVTTSSDDGGRGFAIKHATIVQLYELGFEGLSFTISAPSPYINVYHDTGDNHNALSGGTKKGAEYSYASGQTVLINLKTLATASGWGTMGFGVYFVMTKSLSWDFFTEDGDIVLSGITFITHIPTAEEKAFALLTDEDSYQAHTHGGPAGLTVDDGVITIAVTTSNDTGRGFAIKPATIVALYELGFDSVSFTISAPSPYIDIYHDCGSYTALSDNGTLVDGSDMFYTSGTTVTINIRALATAAGWGTTGYGLYFVEMNSTTWPDFYTTDGNITLSDVTFVEHEVTKEEIALESAFEILYDENSYQAHTHGGPDSITVDGDTITFSVVMSTDDGGRGFAIKPGTITALYQLGFESISFTITAPSPYINVYHDTGNNHNALSGGTLQGPEYSYASGDTVTIDIKTLATAYGWGPGTGSGVYFVMTNSLAWDFYTEDGDIVLSDIDLVFPAPATDPFEIMSDIGSYQAQAHGRPDGITVEDDAITIAVTTSNDTGRGFAIKPETVTALYELGYEGLSFTVTADSPYIDIYHDCGSYTALSDNGTLVDGSDMFYTSGTTVTINLKALATAAGWGTTGYGLYFVEMNSTTWPDFYTTDGNITLSDVTFIKHFYNDAERDEQALLILSETSSYHACTHGGPAGITVEDNTITIAVTTSNDAGRGFAIKPETVVSLYEIGVRSITFTITATSPYINVYHDTNRYYLALSANGEFDANQDSRYYASGDTITIDIKMLASASGWLTDGYGIYFVMVTGVAWDFYTMDGEIVLSNIEFNKVVDNGGNQEEPTEKTAEEQAFAVLTDLDGYGNLAGKCWANNVAVDGDDIVVSTTGNERRGFTWTPSMIKAIYDLGFESLSFDITSPSGYVCVYHDVGSLAALSGAERVDGGDNYYASGSTVTINIKVLAENSEFLAASLGVYFVLTPDATWTMYTTDCDVTISNVVFA